MEKKEAKLVDYSDSSSSSEEKVTISYPKIAVVMPVQSVRPEPTPEPESPEPTSQLDETTEFDPDESQTRQSDEQDIIQIPEEIPEPEIIVLSSDSDTLSIRTDTTLGMYLKLIYQDLKINIVT